MGSVVRVYPGPPFAFVDGGAARVANAVKLGVRDMVLMDGLCADHCQLKLVPKDWGCSSAGRAPALQAGGQRFDPAQLHQFASERRRWCRDDGYISFEEIKVCIDFGRMPVLHIS